MFPDRRRILSWAGALPLAACSAAAVAGESPSRPLSRAAQRGMLPNVPLVAHTGETFNFYDDLVRDRIVLLNFFIVSCTEGRCLPASFNLRKVQDLIGDRMGKDVFFYSITLQPELDSVKRLKEYAEDVVEAGPGWLFLTGEEDDLDHLRRAQGFVDPDPERDRDVNNHASMGRIICDRRERWGTANLLTSPRNIRSSFSVFL